MTNPARHAYGDDRSQFGELYRPTAGPRAGTVVIIHGGFWRARYDLSLGRPLALDLAARGHAVWNLEYRRVGLGGGWPATGEDVSDGIDLLATLDVDTSAVIAIGHSAGGQLAAWAAARAAPRVAVSAVISQAGVLDLAVAAERGVGQTAVPDLMGGLPAEVPERYASADPIAQLPLPVPVLCVHSRADDAVPIEQSEAYVAAAVAAGMNAQLVATSGDHFTLIDPSTPDWTVVVDALPELLSEP